jgi:hypothetical protein
MTISWMSALIAYDGWAIFCFVGVGAIILGPLRRSSTRTSSQGTLTERLRLGRGPQQAGMGCP